LTWESPDVRPFAFTGERGDVLRSGAEFREFFLIETRGHDDEAITLESGFEIFRLGHDRSADPYRDVV
jgi:hypothetical protein